VLAVALPSGCSEPEKEAAVPVWEKVKITDLAPTGPMGRPRDWVLRTVSLDIYALEIPAANIDQLDEAFGLLYKTVVRLKDERAFDSNLFRVGFGKLYIWDNLRSKLFDAGATNIQRISLLIPLGQSEDLKITPLPVSRQMFYIAEDDSMKSRTVGPGWLNLRLEVQRVAGARGVCRVEGYPVVSPPQGRAIPKLEEQRKAQEFELDWVGFNLKMSPGEFIILGPKLYSPGQMTLGSLFFSRPLPKPMVRVYWIVCARIVD